MATVKGALALYDGMTGPLKNIHNALNIVLNSFEAVQNASENVIDVSAIQEAREELARAEATWDNIENSIRGADQAQDDFNNRVRDGTASANGLYGAFSKLKGIIATIGVTAGIKKLVNLSDQFTSTRARLNLIADDAGNIETIQKQIDSLPNAVMVDVSATPVDGNLLDGLAKGVTTPVDVADQNAINTIQDKLDGLTEKATIPVTADIETNISDNKTVEQFANKIDSLPNTVTVDVSATDNNSVSEVKSRIDGLEEAVSIPVNVTDNNSVKILEAKIWASAQRSRASYFDTAAAIASMGANAKSAFGTNDELIAFMEQINKQFVIGGASAQGQAAAMLQLTQAMGAGALRGEELNSILENAPGIARAIEQYMGVAEGSIKKYAEQGLITAEVVKNAMFAAADETNAKFESMPTTWGQVWTGMQNRAIVILDPLLSKINQIANSERIQGVVDGIMGAFSAVVAVALFALDLISAVGGGIYDNWCWIEPIVLGVAGAMLFYLAVTKGVAIAEGIASVATAAYHTVVNFLSIGFGILTGNTAAASAAVFTFNSALMACPIMWIVILVIALVAAFYAAVAAVNKFAGTSISATGVICGAFMAALAFIGNIFVALWNLVVDVFTLIYNLVATVANFIGNVFTDPVGAVARLFFDLADTVLGVLQSLAGAIDAIFGSDLSGAVQGWRDSLGGWVDDTFGEGKEVMAKMNADDLKLGRFEYGAAYDLGYNFGEGIEDTVSGMFKMPTLDEMGMDDFGNNLEGIYGNTGDTAANTANTAATADAIEYTDEDLKYLRDIAEREAINRYTTAQITIEQHNENHISKDTDLDGIMEAWTADFAEKLDISGEGV